MYCHANTDTWGGKGEKFLGTTPTIEECFEMVKAKEPTATGATFSQTYRPGSCYAEFGTKVVSYSTWQTCLFINGKKLNFNLKYRFTVLVLGRINLL